MCVLCETGNVKTVMANQVEFSRIGLGFEKLDRDVFDPNKAYDKVAELGVKWIRIQSGWARTEKQPGLYDFDWLDDIVDNLLKRGLKPWMCLCYGNGLYSEEAAKVFGAVGCPPIFTNSQKQSWTNYVQTVTVRYRGKIEWYEVWNEPDGKWCWKHGPDGTEYGEFVIRTAKAIKAGDINAKVIAGSMCFEDYKWLNGMLRTGAAEFMDGFTYHAYTTDETDKIRRVNSIKSLCHMYNPKIEIIQGETGTQSRSDGRGALSGGRWTEDIQAKFLVRHMCMDMITNVKFSSYFSCLDMVEALNGLTDDVNSYQDYGYYGVLRAEFDKNGFSTGEYSLKPSYKALQTIAAVFKGEFYCYDLPFSFDCVHSSSILRKDDNGDGLIYGGFLRSDGSKAFVYWKPTEILTTVYESTITLCFVGMKQSPKIIDLLNGKIYCIADEHVESDGDGYIRIKNIPLRDYPLMIVFGDFVG